MVIHNNPSTPSSRRTDRRPRPESAAAETSTWHPSADNDLGFVGLTIPYAFGMAAFDHGLSRRSWLRAVRRWTISRGSGLSIGLMLAMNLGVRGLGWGGTGLDPVENAGLLPWFTATAFRLGDGAGEARHAGASGTCRTSSSRSS